MRFQGTSASNAEGIRCRAKKGNRTKLESLHTAWNEFESACESGGESECECVCVCVCLCV